MSIKNLLIVCCGFISALTAIDLVVFEEFGSAPLTDMVMDNNTVDDFEIVLDLNKKQQRLSVGDLSICFSWYFENRRSPDGTDFKIQIQLFQNESDIQGTKDYIYLQEAILPSFYGPKVMEDPYGLKHHWGNTASPTWAKYKDKEWYKNWFMSDGWGLKPHHWISMCHLLDKQRNMCSIYLNGEHLADEELKGSAGPPPEWPKYKIQKLLLSTTFTNTNNVPTGKFTALNIFSRTLSSTEAKQISSKYNFLHRKER